MEHPSEDLPSDGSPSDGPEEVEGSPEEVPHEVVVPFEKNDNGVSIFLNF